MSRDEKDQALPPIGYTFWVSGQPDRDKELDAIDICCQVIEAFTAQGEIKKRKRIASYLAARYDTTEIPL